MEFFAFALIPIGIAIVAKFILRLDICWAEWAMQTVLGLVVTGAVFVMVSIADVRDTRVVTGEVTKTYSETFRCYRNQIMSRCRNSYSCNCKQVCTGTGKDRRCWTECDTCYRYPWERNWYLDHTAIANGTIEISRVDSQGANAPARWSLINLGDSVSVTTSFVNYVKPVSNSLNNLGGLDIKSYRENGLLPEWPSRVRDYYRVDRLVVVGARVSKKTRADWASEIQNSLKKTKMNFVLVVTKNQTPEYSSVLLSHWKGFKDNEAVLIINLDQQNRVQWVDSLSWAGDQMYNVKAKKWATQYVGQSFVSISANEFMEGLRAEAYPAFKPTPMEEFAYLKGTAPISKFGLWVIGIFSVLASIGLTVLFHRTNFRELY